MIRDIIFFLKKTKKAFAKQKRGLYLQPLRANPDSYRELEKWQSGRMHWS